MPTLTVYPTYPVTTTTDGYAGRSATNETFATLRSGAGTFVASAGGVVVSLSSGSTSNKWNQIYRSFTLFDTSALPVGATVDSAVLSLYGAGKTGQLSTADTLNICSANPASDTAFVNADYSQLGSTSFGSVSYSSFLVEAYNDITLNSDGLNNIASGGISKFGFRLGSDINNTTPTWASSKNNTFTTYGAYETGTSKDPKLVITYTLNAPTVTSSAVSDIGLVTATGNGNVTSDGGDTITERGVCWNTTGSPTTADSKATSAGTTGTFTASMTGLLASTTYYAKAYATNSTGTSYGTEVSFTTQTGFTDPTNAYSSNNVYATTAGDTGAILVSLSGDAGVTYSSVLTKTYTGVESSQTYGAGSSELWGLTWLGTNINDTNFRLKISAGSLPNFQVYKTFGFAPAGTVTLTGIEVSVEAKWDGVTTSVDHIKVKIYYGTSITPVVAGSVAYATDGATTGALEAYNGSNWKEVTDVSSVQTLTNKTISASTNTLTGVVTPTSTDVLTNKTLTSPLFKGTIDGWIDANETWTYASGATTNVGTFTVAGVDLTTKYQAGDKVKFTQTTVKYAFITKVAFSTDTTITIYMGTDYTIANAAISANYYSRDKSPFGFPLAPAKWTITTTLSTDRTTSSTSYATLTDTIVLPIGVWRLTLKTIVDAVITTANSRTAFVILSSDASTETNSKLTLYNGTTNPQYSSGNLIITTMLFSEDSSVTTAASTTFTLMGKVSSTSITLHTRNDTQNGFIQAICAYL